jgi:uncharacterized protein
MTMQTNLLWTGREYHSMENCLVNTGDAGSEIKSVIVGTYEGIIYKVEYTIRTNRDWMTLFCEVNSQHSDRIEHILLESDGKGNWLMHGKEVKQFKGCMDVDIPLTPFTNTLPINRLGLEPGAGQQIGVIYIDILGGQIRAVNQKYLRRSDKIYHYENVPNDFEANIEVDDLGLVVDYPALFVRSAKLETGYPH